MTPPNKAQGTGGEKTKCPFCDGRGWYIGECHPQEACGPCDATGWVGTFQVTEAHGLFLDQLERCTCGFFTTSKMPRADGKDHEHAPTCPLR